MAGHTSAGTHADTTQTLRLPLGVLWECGLSGGTGSGAAIVVDSILVCGTLQGEFYAIDMMNGKEFGSRKISSPIAAAPLAVGNELYLCTKAGRETIFDYNIRSGEYVWRKNIGGVAAPAIISRHAIVVGTLEGQVLALRPSHGGVLWTYACGAPIHGSPCTDDSLVYAADTRGGIHALSAATGALAWKRALPGAVYAGLSTARGIVYAGSRDNRLYALDARTGTILWSYDTGERIMASASANDSIVVVGALNGSVTALTHEGAVVWTFSARSAVNTPSIILRDIVVVTSLDTHIYALSLRDGAVLWKHSIGARIKTAPVVWNGSLIVIGDDKTVYRFTSK